MNPLEKAIYTVPLSVIQKDCCVNLIRRFR